MLSPLILMIGDAMRRDKVSDRMVGRGFSGGKQDFNREVAPRDRKGREEDLAKGGEIESNIGERQEYFLRSRAEVAKNCEVWRWRKR